jgi:hypothetical protein
MPDRDVKTIPTTTTCLRQKRLRRVNIRGQAGSDPPGFDKLTIYGENDWFYDAILKEAEEIGQKVDAIAVTFSDMKIKILALRIAEASFNRRHSIGLCVRMR